MPNNDPQAPDVPFWRVTRRRMIGFICIAIIVAVGAALVSALLVNINQRKQGCYLPSTGIPIVAPAEAARRGVRTVIVVNPAYVGEVESLCASDGLPFRVQSIDDIEGL